MPSPDGAGLALVLVRPRDPNNIGGAARAMANFGLDDLRLVAPHPPVWREAKSAVGAERLLGRARVFGSVDEAVSDRQVVWGASSLKGRRPGLEVSELPDVARPEGRVAVLFGPEKTGLTADDLDFCSALLRVPTAAAAPSMNLAAAVAVVAYAWSQAKPAAAAGAGPPAGVAQRERLLDAAEAAADAVGYRRDLGEGRRRRWRRALSRWGVSASQAGALLEALRKVRPASR